MDTVFFKMAKGKKNNGRPVISHDPSKYSCVFDTEMYYSLQKNLLIMFCCTPWHLFEQLWLLNQSVI